MNFCVIKFLTLNSISFFVFIICSASLVPVYSFGETDTYYQPSNEVYQTIQAKIQAVTKAPVIAFFKGRGFFQSYFGILPYRTPITTVSKYYILRSLNTEKIHWFIFIVCVCVWARVFKIMYLRMNYYLATILSNKSKL